MEVASSAAKIQIMDHLQSGFHQMSKQHDPGVCPGV